MQLNAFVGHSFDPADKNVVESFLDFFDHVNQLGIDFTWDHAENAEPKELSHKVKEKMEGKNVFIGICTPRETVITTEYLSPVPFFPKQLRAQKDGFETKTSDWILQEIGCAVAKKMSIIILLETGVRHPGGLQGDIEYIEFNRNNPEKVFTKILEMLQVLMPTETSIEKVRTAAPADEPEETTSTSDKEIGEKKPITDWTLEEFANEIFYSIIDDNSSKEEEIYQKYAESEVGSSEEDRATLEAYRLYVKIIFKKKDLFDQLLDMMRSYPTNPRIMTFVARIYNNYKEYGLAAEYYEKSAAHTEDLEKKYDQLSEACIAYAKSGEEIKSKALLDECKTISEKCSNGQLLLLKTLADLTEELGRSDENKAFNEAILKLNPDDHTRRFSLAYNYADQNERDFALYHYRILSRMKPDGVTWNNLGVSLDKLDLPSSAVLAYREAEKLEETLAMSNLANKFLKEGFVAEAEELMNKATTTKNYHPNVGDTISRAKNSPMNEKEKEEEYLEKIKVVRQFLIDYAHSCTEDNVQSVPKQWQGPKCKFNLSIQNGILTLAGHYEIEKKKEWWQPKVPGTTQEKEMIRENIKYEGNLSGYGVNFQRWSWQGNSPLSKSAESKAKGFMILDKDVKKIKIYEIGSRNKNDIIELVALED